MRLLNDCTIVEVDDEFGKGIQVWSGAGALFLGRFQTFGMKVEGVAKLAAERATATHDDDLLMIFVDRRHMDDSWMAFRVAMIRAHLVYIPDECHYPECEGEGLWPILRWMDRWMSLIATSLITIHTWLLWFFGDPVSLFLAISVLVLSLVIAIETGQRRTGAI